MELVMMLGPTGSFILVGWILAYKNWQKAVLVCWSAWIAFNMVEIAYSEVQILVFVQFVAGGWFGAAIHSLQIQSTKWRLEEEKKKDQ